LLESLPLSRNIQAKTVKTVSAMRHDTTTTATMLALFFRSLGFCPTSTPRGFIALELGSLPDEPSRFIFSGADGGDAGKPVQFIFSVLRSLKA
jgi:hypothetical protein